MVEPTRATPAAETTSGTEVKMPNPVIAMLQATYGDRVKIGVNVVIDPDVRISIFGEGRLTIGNNVGIRRGTTIEVYRCASMHFGEGAQVGEHCFLAATGMIYIGKGCGISNLVDMHDHNHRPRTMENADARPLEINSSGFDVAPIVIESGAVLSNKVSVTAGVRIGQNTIVGANSAVTRSLPANCTAAGSPAKPINFFEGPLAAIEPKRVFRLGFFGDSIFEHLQAHVPDLYRPGATPEVGATLQVDSWIKGGAPARLSFTLQAQYPELEVQLVNAAKGGSTSRDVLRRLNASKESSNPAQPRYDISFLCVGINDVWRSFQGRESEAVTVEEFRSNCSAILRALGELSHRVIAVAPPPVSTPEFPEMMSMIGRYVQVMREEAGAFGAGFLDTPTAMLKSKAQLEAGLWSDVSKNPSLWVDGVHLSELGDTLFEALITRHLEETNVVEKLLTLPRVKYPEGIEVYKEILQQFRALE